MEQCALCLRNIFPLLWLFPGKMVSINLNRWMGNDHFGASTRASVVYIVLKKKKKWVKLQPNCHQKCEIWTWLGKGLEIEVVPCVRTYVTCTVLPEWNCPNDTVLRHFLTENFCLHDLWNLSSVIMCSKACLTHKLWEI